jgi:hypothetical protein
MGSLLEEQSKMDQGEFTRSTDIDGQTAPM